MIREVRKFGTSDAATRLFLFGSALYSENPRDIDILVVYTASLTPGAALQFHTKLVRKLKKYFAVPIHVVLLSQSEECEVESVKTENCRLLIRQDIRRWHTVGR